MNLVCRSKICIIEISTTIDKHLVGTIRNRISCIFVLRTDFCNSRNSTLYINTLSWLSSKSLSYSIRIVHRTRLIGITIGNRQFVSCRRRIISTTYACVRSGDCCSSCSNKRYSTEVVANNIYFGESRRSNDGGNYAPRSGNTGYGGNGGYQNGGGNNYGGGYAGGNVPSAYEPSGAPAVSEFAELGDDDGELPF